MYSHTDKNSAPQQQRPTKPALQPGDQRQDQAAQLQRQQLANNSPQAHQLWSLQRMADRAVARVHPAQLKSKKKVDGAVIWYADNEGEARQLMEDYADRIGLDWAKLDDGLKQVCVSFAQDYKKEGINGGEKLLFGELREMQERQRRQNRYDLVQADRLLVLPDLTDPLALSVFQVAHATYVGGAQINAGVAGTYSEDDYYNAKAIWDALDDVGQITKFESYDPEDKEEAGKGNVGATLDTRKVQGNMFVRFAGLKINVHVNIV